MEKDYIDELIETSYEILYLCCYVNENVHVVVTKKITEALPDDSNVQKLVIEDIDCGIYLNEEVCEQFYYNKLKEKLRLN